MGAPLRLRESWPAWLRGLAGAGTPVMVAVASSADGAASSKLRICAARRSSSIGVPDVLSRSCCSNSGGINGAGGVASEPSMLFMVAGDRTSPHLL